MNTVQSNGDIVITEQEAGGRGLALPPTQTAGVAPDIHEAMLTLLPPRNDNNNNNNVRWFDFSSLVVMSYLASGFSLYWRLLLAYTGAHGMKKLFS